MTATPSILGLLPARRGSKGIPGKNLRPICGRPLVGWAAEALATASGIRTAICSTDDSEIAAEARRWGLKTPFVRPAELATDTATVADVVLHALDALDHPYTHVLLVQATSPTVTPELIERAIAMLNDGADTVITGFSCGMHHPSVMYTLNENENVQWFLSDGKHVARRQDFPEVFIRTGLVYLISVDVMRKTGSIYGNDVRAIQVEEDIAVTIDEERDIILAELAMKDRKHD